MSSVNKGSFSIEFKRASEGCCGTATGFMFSHPGFGKESSRYYVYTSDSEAIAIERTAGDHQALDELPGQLAFNIIGSWLRHDVINSLANLPPRQGATTQCTVR